MRKESKAYIESARARERAVVAVARWRWPPGVEKGSRGTGEAAREREPS